MAFTFKPAVKTAAKLRLALAGPAGAGKTYSALAIATALAQGGKVAVIDTEHGSASKYSDVFAFDTLELDSFSPSTYVEAIHAAEAAGYPVLVIDSLSHAWMGKDGALEQVDRIAKRSQSGNSFGAWRDVTPLHNQLVEAMLAARMHIVATLRSKMDHVQEKDDRGRTVIRKVGLAPVQREGLEYEFDVYGDLTIENDLIVGKTRCSALAGKIIPKPGAQMATVLLSWLDGAPVMPPENAETARPGNQPGSQVRLLAGGSSPSEPVTSPAHELIQQERAQMNLPVEGGDQAAKETRRNPALAELWQTAERGVTSLKTVGVDKKLPPDHADSDVLTTFIETCRQDYAKARPQRTGAK